VENMSASTRILQERSNSSQPSVNAFNYVTAYKYMFRWCSCCKLRLDCRIRCPTLGC
jgi:hypothetical protein